MKRLITVASAIILFAGITSAQNYSAALNTFNQANQKIETSKLDALNLYKSALTQFKTCKDAKAKEMVGKCEESISQTLLSLAKDQLEEDQYKKAAITLREALAVAENYGISTVAEEAKSLIADPRANKRPEDRIAYGKELLGKGDVDGAIAEFEVAASKGKTDEVGDLLFEAFLQKGQALLKKEEKEKALQFLEEAQKIKKTPKSLLLVAATAYSLKTHEGLLKSISNYEEYLETYPDSGNAPAIMLQQARNYINLRDYQKALTLVQRSNEIKESENNKALISMLQKQIDSSRELAKAQEPAEKKEPERQVILNEKGETDEALAIKENTHLSEQKNLFVGESTENGPDEIVKTRSNEEDVEKETKLASEKQAMGTIEEKRQDASSLNNKKEEGGLKVMLEGFYQLVLTDSYYYAGGNVCFGYQKDKLFLGVGLGVTHTLGLEKGIIIRALEDTVFPPSSISYPVFAHVRYYVPMRKLSPYLGLTAGMRLSPEQTAIFPPDDLKYKTSGALVIPQIGIAFPFFGKSELCLSLGYAAQSWTKVETIVDQSVTFSKPFYSSLDARIGLTF